MSQILGVKVFLSSTPLIYFIFSLKHAIFVGVFRHFDTNEHNFPGGRPYLFRLSDMASEATPHIGAPSCHFLLTGTTKRTSVANHQFEIWLHRWQSKYLPYHLCLSMSSFDSTASSSASTRSHGHFLSQGLPGNVWSRLIRKHSNYSAQKFSEAKKSDKWGKINSRPPRKSDKWGKISSRPLKLTGVTNKLLKFLKRPKVSQSPTETELSTCRPKSQARQNKCWVWPEETRGPLTRSEKQQEEVVSRVGKKKE